MVGLESRALVMEGKAPVLAKINPKSLFIIYYLSQPTVETQCVFGSTYSQDLTCLDAINK